MAIDITINLTDADAAELTALTNDHNAAFPPAMLTPAQYLRRDVRSRLELSAQQRSDTQRLGMRATYKTMTAVDQAAVDAIFAKYQTLQVI